MVSEDEFLQMDVEELRPQFIEAFEGADYPINSNMDLVPALPNGPATSFESNGVEFSILEMDNIDETDGDTDIDIDESEVEPEYPYEDVESFVDDLCEGMEQVQNAVREARQEG